MKVTSLQRAVLVYMARGYTPKQIGACLGRSSNSVCAARRRVMRRYRVTNDTQLGMLVSRSGLLSEGELELIEQRRQVKLRQQELQ